MRRPCIVCWQEALPGQSRCRDHIGGSSWAKYIAKHPERATLYRSGSWRAARNRQLAEHPYCFCGKKATHVDHIRNRAEGGADLDPANLRSLCAEHHRAKTLAESHRGMKRAAERRRRGRF